MKVLLTGATGYVGSRVADRLVARGHQVVGITRRADAADQLARRGVEPFIADLTQTDRLAEVAKACDGVIHTAFSHDFDYATGVAMDRAVHEAFVGALAGTGKPLVVSNGTAGFGDTGDRVADETTPIDLEQPLAVRTRVESLAAEAAGVKGIAVRLPLLVYGHGGSVFLPMLIQSARRLGVSYYISDGSNRMSTVHVDDAADLYALALERGRAGEVYIAGGGEDVELRAVAEAVAHGVGNGCRVESVTPDRAAAIWDPVWAKMLALTNRVSGRKAKGELGWTPRSSPTLLDDVARGSYAVSPQHAEAAL
ncbi:NAD-dependent epimerase/dehydratase family protein [Roseomonas genomospecies 6]|uniref:NAD-dependent epimerase/dehydratase family protein n=1 Tax=Roseomonas genomospecies 6 TaxID=214106 RepID=A0A9W7NI98_9PROT|nr:NAD-dependent epimerase/dehydratase family protein [Roseomonas genomospecies 6]KAA0679484.1 NAD-dependent epimerase/dehydratase family protein [Roseomonas genomospecies 6]